MAQISIGQTNLAYVQTVNYLDSTVGCINSNELTENLSNYNYNSRKVRKDELVLMTIDSIQTLITSSDQIHSIYTDNLFKKCSGIKVIKSFTFTYSHTAIIDTIPIVKIFAGYCVFTIIGEHDVEINSSSKKIIIGCDIGGGLELIFNPFYYYYFLQTSEYKFSHGVSTIKLNSANIVYL